MCTLYNCFSLLMQWYTRILRIRKRSICRVTVKDIGDDNQQIFCRADSIYTLEWARMIGPTLCTTEQKFKVEYQIERSLKLFFRAYRIAQYIYLTMISFHSGMLSPKCCCKSAILCTNAQHIRIHFQIKESAKIQTTNIRNPHRKS
jgi:hypothetical protein